LLLQEVALIKKDQLLKLKYFIDQNSQSSFYTLLQLHQ